MGWPDSHWDAASIQAAIKCCNEFDACRNTRKKIQQKSGLMPSR